MPISIKCPSCAFVGTAPDHAAGKQATCPKCKRPFLVGAFSATAPASSPLPTQPMMDLPSPSIAPRIPWGPVPWLLLIVIGLLGVNLIVTIVSGGNRSPAVLPLAPPSTNSGGGGEKAPAPAAGAPVVVARQQWEYKIDSILDSIFDQQMRRLGEEGWDLVFARRATSGGVGGFPLYEVILKRPLTK